MRLLYRLAILFALGTLSACDKRPINPTAALPAPGSAVPAFAFPAHGGTDSVRSTTLTGAPTVLALWSTHCPYQVPWVAALDSLAREYVPRGVHVVVLADDAPGPMLDSVLAGAAWRSAVTQVGVADGGLAALFDQSRSAPERARERVEFVLPSFLLIGPDGRVVRRAWGPTTSFLPALDSLLQAPKVGANIPAVQRRIAAQGV